MKLDPSEAPSVVYKRPGAPSLAAYHRFIIDPVLINYNDPKMQEIKPEDIGRMSQYFHDVMIKELRDGGYEVGTRAQANTLRVTMILSGLKAPTAAANVSVLAAPFAVSVDEVTVEAVFREATTNRTDAVVVTRSQGSRILNPTPWSTWADVQKSFDQWAKGLRKAVDKAHGR